MKVRLLFATIVLTAASVLAQNQLHWRSRNPSPLRIFA